jgi:hypothetical protein
MIPLRPFRPARSRCRSCCPCEQQTSCAFHGVEVAILDVDDDTRRRQGVLIAMHIAVEG